MLTRYFEWRASRRTWQNCPLLLLLAASLTVPNDDFCSNTTNLNPPAGVEETRGGEFDSWLDFLMYVSITFNRFTKFGSHQTGRISAAIFYKGPISSGERQREKKIKTRHLMCGRTSETAVSALL
jgi:hypothetical protein